MQDLWGDENNTYKFFTYMCPRLHDLGTVTYWILEKEAHSPLLTGDPLWHVHQVILDLHHQKGQALHKILKA